MSDKRYRIVDRETEHGPPVFQVWRVARKTPKGAWIVPPWAFYEFSDRIPGVAEVRDRMGGRFVLNGDGKRFAYETEAQARASYKIRKQRQIQHARYAIEVAERGLAWLEDPKPFEVYCPFTDLDLLKF